MAVDAFGRGRSADHIDGVLHGPAHGAHGRDAVGPGQRGIRGGEQSRAPAAVTPRSPEAGHLLLDDGDAQGRIDLGQRVGGPQPGEPGPDDADVDLCVRTEWRSDRKWLGNGIPPEGEVLIAHRPFLRRVYIRRHASVSTSRKVETMNSISAGPQMSGGDSCTTGSPRSSARQMSPASNRAPER